jgi:hypothetical protein
MPGMATENPRKGDAALPINMFTQAPLTGAFFN